MSGSEDGSDDRRRDAESGRGGVPDRGRKSGPATGRDSRSSYSPKPKSDGGGRDRRGQDDHRKGTPKNRGAGPARGAGRRDDDQRTDQPRRRDEQAGRSGDRHRRDAAGPPHRKPTPKSGEGSPSSAERPQRKFDSRRGNKQGDRGTFQGSAKKHRDKDGGGARGSQHKPAARNKDRTTPSEVEATVAPKPAAPELPEGAEASELHGEVRRELKSLPKGLADKVAAHLVAAGSLLDSQPEDALNHARYARQRASRIGVVREANGIAAYQNGEWSEALSELRAARRMGVPGHVAVMADCERALGRPERALDLSRSPEAAELTGEGAVELRIVAAGARRDLGEIEASVVSLQIPELDPEQQQPWSARLFYAYADNLLAANRVKDSFTWFVHAANADDDGETDAADRLEELVSTFGGEQFNAEVTADGITVHASEDDVP